MMGALSAFFSACSEVLPFMKDALKDCRYSLITEKNPREIVLLRGNGCKWKRCKFCDYHMDFSKNEQDNAILNRGVLSRVTGKYGSLEVINYGSIVDLNRQTLEDIIQVCKTKNITRLHFESHWMHRQDVVALKAIFDSFGITAKAKIGVETFEYTFRESYLNKGIPESDPKNIAKYFDEVCLLQGLTGQTEDTMRRDIEIGLHFFERVCVNIMVANKTQVHPDQAVIDTFMKAIYPNYRNNSRVDILLHNTDFGVGK